MYDYLSHNKQYIHRLVTQQQPSGNYPVLHLISSERHKFPLEFSFQTITRIRSRNISSRCLHSTAASLCVVVVCIVVVVIIVVVCIVVVVVVVVVVVIVVICIVVVRVTVARSVASIVTDPAILHALATECYETQHSNRQNEQTEHHGIAVSLVSCCNLEHITFFLEDNCILFHDVRFCNQRLKFLLVFQY